MRAKVAIITRTKNRPLLLPRCIQSVLNQTYGDWLHVIVNDGGDPATVESVVSRFAGQYNGRLQVIHNPKSLGMQHASNLGIKACESELIAIHDDDDTWNEMFLEECVRYLDAAGLESKEQGVAAQSFWIMEEIDSWGKVVEISRQNFLPFESVSLFQLAARNQFPPIAFLYRRAVHEKIGWFDQAFNELGDHDFNLRFLAHYDIGTIPKRLANYHWRHQSNGSSYANTVTDGVASHRKTSVRMQNHYLQADLASGRVGLGFLLNISSSLEAQKEKIQILANKTENTAGHLHEVSRRLLYYQKKIDALLKPWKAGWPGSVYDHLADWVSSRAANSATPHNGNGHVAADILRDDDATRMRMVRKSTDVYLYMQGDVRRLLNRPTLGFITARMAAERELANTPPGVGNGSGLDGVYEALRRRLDIDEKTATRIKELEIETERKLGCQILQPVQSPSKTNGANGFDTHSLTHPATEKPLVDQHTSLSGAWEDDLASSLYTGLARRRRLQHPFQHAQGKAFWEMIGYEVMGPLHHAFLSCRIARASKLELKKLFFLSRDGYQLVKGFDQFRQKLGLQINGEYLFASRRLWNVARIDRLDEENLAFLVSPNPRMRVRDFLGRIGIDPVSHEALVRRLGFTGLDELVSTQGGVFKSEALHQNMRRLFRELEEKILEQARREREVLLNYFEEIGLLEDGVGIVDIGWAASSSRALQKILALAGMSWRIPAFYFGTWKTAQSVAEAGCQIASFFMSFGQPQHRGSILSEGVELIEAFFSAPHPTIIGVEKKNGKWEPVYGEPEMDKLTEASLLTAAGTASEFLRDALELLPAGQEVDSPFGYLETVLERLLRFPTHDEAVAFGKFSWRNTFGGNGPLRHLANPPSHWKRIARGQALQEAYDHSYWRKGFLAQLSPRARKYVKV